MENGIILLVFVSFALLLIPLVINSEGVRKVDEVRDSNCAESAVITFWTTLVVIILLLGTLTVFIIERDREEESMEEELQEQQARQLADSVQVYIEQLNIKHPEIVFKQAILESGNFQSRIFKENNNMFGFKQAYKRPNTQIGTNRGYAVYESWKECVIDYALYQTYSAKNLSEEDYLKFLGKNFAEDPEYIDKISD